MSFGLGQSAKAEKVRIPEARARAGQNPKKRREETNTYMKAKMPFFVTGGGLSLSEKPGWLGVTRLLLFEASSPEKALGNKPGHRQVQPT